MNMMECCKTDKNVTDALEMAKASGKIVNF